MLEREVVGGLGGREGTLVFGVHGRSGLLGLPGLLAEARTRLLDRAGIALGLCRLATLSTLTTLTTLTTLSTLVAVGLCRAIASLPTLVAAAGLGWAIATLVPRALVAAAGLGWAIATLRGGVSLTVRAASQELEGVGHHLGGVAFVSGLIRPLAGAELTFDIELRAFVYEFFHDICVAAPDYDVVPFCVFPLLSVAVTVPFRCGQTERGHLHIGIGILGIGFKVTYFGVISNVTDKHYFVQ